MNQEAFRVEESSSRFVAPQNIRAVEQRTRTGSELRRDIAAYNPVR
jgi:hypothetical protein